MMRCRGEDSETLSAQRPRGQHMIGQQEHRSIPRLPRHTTRLAVCSEKPLVELPGMRAIRVG